MADLEGLRARLAHTPTTGRQGHVRAVTGLSIRAALPGARIGDLLNVHRRGDPLLAEVVGFDRGEVIAMPFGELGGVGADDVVEATEPLGVMMGPGVLGRVLDGLGRPLDGGPPIEGTRYAVDRPPPMALSRQPVSEPLPTGVRAIDALLTLGRGQRVGLFSASGVGKSSLLGAMARGASADVVVVALVGERGREVGDFIARTLGPARPRSVVVAATSDASALERLHAAQAATAVAEYFRDTGKDVLLLVDSVTRIARAQREVGLAAGEPPARRGYPPSVFAMLPRLLERSGQGENGSVTAVYTVLVEGDDMDEPVADEVRGILDGHIVLSRALALRGHYPAIDVGASVSRVMPHVTDSAHVRAAERVRALLAAYEGKRDLIALGAYKSGTEPFVDRAIQAMPRIEDFLRQPLSELSTLEQAVEGLEGLARQFA